MVDNEELSIKTTKEWETMRASERVKIVEPTSAATKSRAAGYVKKNREKKDNKALVSAAKRCQQLGNICKI